MEFLEEIAKYGPQILPVVTAILVIVFTKRYVYSGMIPEAMFSEQITRERDRLKEQAERDKLVVEAAKDLEQHLEEIVYQLQNLTKKVSEEVGDNNARITGLERFLSEQLDTIREMTTMLQQLAFQCEKHRKGIPDTEVFLSEKRPAKGGRTA